MKSAIRFKLAALALVSAALLSAQAHAGQAQAESLQALPVAAFSQTDINAMFEQAGQPMQLAALSSAEMKETEGAAVPILLATGGWMVGGAALGGLNHLRAGAPRSQLWRSVGMGATGGFYASPLARGVFGAHHFARFTAGSLGAGSWWVHGRR